MSGEVLTRLRPVHDEERPLLARWRAEPASPFEDFGGPPPPLLTAAERAAPRQSLGPGSGELTVTDGGDLMLGWVSWHPVMLGPGPGCTALNVGITLRAAARGHGHGTRAQRLLADWLFATTSVHRVEAGTDIDNIAEQRALAGAGFRREGVARGAQWRDRAYRDVLVYARLRSDA